MRSLRGAAACLGCQPPVSPPTMGGPGAFTADVASKAATDAGAGTDGSARNIVGHGIILSRARCIAPQAQRTHTLGRIERLGRSWVIVVPSHKYVDESSLFCHRREAKSKKTNIFWVRIAAVGRCSGAIREPYSSEVSFLLRVSQLKKSMIFVRLWITLYP